jgi:DNA-binding transcriptional MerR regulator
MLQFSIKELEILSGIKAHTIRIWEQRYNFLKPSRSYTNIRFYSREELKLILNVSLLNNYGFKISHISEMPAEKIQEAIVNLNETGAQETFMVHQLFLKLFDLDIDGFYSLLNEYTSKENVNETISKIIDPFLHKVELLSNEGYLKKEYQQLISNSIRQTLIAGISEQNVVRNENDKIIISFLPENHYYEIDLLYMQYLLRRKGAHIIYLGANVPVKDVSIIASHNQPCIIHTHLTKISQQPGTYKFVEKLALQFPEISIIITGNNRQWNKKYVPGNIMLKASLEEAASTV